MERVTFWCILTSTQSLWLLYCTRRPWSAETRNTFIIGLTQLYSTGFGELNTHYIKMYKAILSNTLVRYTAKSTVLLILYGAMYLTKGSALLWRSCKRKWTRYSKILWLDRKTLSLEDTVVFNAMLNLEKEQTCSSDLHFMMNYACKWVSIQSVTQR